MYENCHLDHLLDEGTGLLWASYSTGRALLVCGCILSTFLPRYCLDSVTFQQKENVPNSLHFH